MRTDFTPGWPATYRAALLLIEIDSISLIGPNAPSFFLSSFQKWREEIVIKRAFLHVFADLGYGVLDNAKVETSAYCLKSDNYVKGQSVFVRLLLREDKPEELAKAVSSLWQSEVSPDVTIVDSRSFEQVPGSPFVYWVSERVRQVFRCLPKFRTDDRLVCLGDHPSDDFRYLRLHWESPFRAPHREWVPYVKGGKYSPFYREIPLVVDWDSERQTDRGFYGRPGRSNERPSNYKHFFKPGITWSISPYRRGSFSHVPTGWYLATRRNGVCSTAPSLGTLLHTQLRCFYWALASSIGKERQ